VQPDNPRQHRALFISDIHLGSMGCQAERLLGFLRDNDADCIYLVGDIVDGWQLKNAWYWPQPHNDVLHIHHPASRDIAGVHYVNCGDWVESCTVAAETRDGALEILSWAQPSAPVAADRARAA